MDDILKQITDYILIDIPPQKSDVIIVAGGSLPQLAERSAELYRQGYAPFVIAGGRYGDKHGRFVGVGDKAEIFPCSNPLKEEYRVLKAYFFSPAIWAEFF